MTAEYEYENMKRAVESDRVVIFMRIRHNVFTSLAANCTVYYVNGLYSAACVWAAAGDLNAHTCRSFYMERTYLALMTTCHEIPG